MLHVDGRLARGEPAHGSQAALADQPAEHESQQGSGRHGQPKLQAVSRQHLFAFGQQMLPAAVAPSKFPPMIRDIALIVEAQRPVAELLAVLRCAPEPLVQSVEVFDVYQGKGVEPDRKSVAFRIRFQHTEKTLEDREVDSAVEALVGLARTRLGAELRS